MSDCRKTLDQLAPYADGLLSGEDQTRVEHHLGTCLPCRAVADEEQAGRTVVKARAEQLRQVTLPPGLRTRCEARMRAELAPTRPSPWYNRLAAAVTIALIVLATAATIFGLATRRSDVLLARQLTLDHIKCFIVDGDDHADHYSADVAEARMQEQFGWSVPIPTPAARPDVHLVSVRRCLYGEGMVAHVLYRVQDQPVSLFVMPDRAAGQADISAFGRHAQVLTRRGVTYVLVAPAALAGVAAAVGLEAE